MLPRNLSTNKVEDPVEGLTSTCSSLSLQYLYIYRTLLHLLQRRLTSTLLFRPPDPLPYGLQQAIVRSIKKLEETLPAHLRVPLCLFLSLYFFAFSWHHA